ncbi:MAG: hypothetical protein JST90_01535 [Bacteroidetes bacterium]|nr:hypothetical protein [Bacteroidota bacterium]
MHSPFIADEIYGRLEATVDPPQASFAAGNKPYNGTYSRDAFDIVRTIKRRNSFRPVIFGDIEERDQKGCIIYLKLRLHFVVIVLATLWWSFAAFGAISAIIDGRAISNADIFFPVCILIAMYAMLILTFNSESKKSILFLQQLFDATIEKQ